MVSHATKRGSPLAHTICCCIDMEVNANELLLIYNSQKPSDRETLGYLQALKKFKLKEFDIKNDYLTETQIKGIANKLNITSEELMDKHSDVYLDRYAKSRLVEEDILVALKQEPSLMKTPIVIFHDGGQFVNSKFDFIRKEMNPLPLTSSHLNEGEK